MSRETRKRLALTAAPATAYVVLMALVAALWVKPPLLGWIGFAIVAAVGAALIVAGFVLFPRSRANIPSLAGVPRRDGVLVLADTTCSSAELCESITRHLRGRKSDVHVVAPVLPHPRRYLTDDEELDRGDAKRRLDETLERLRDAGIAATGSVGTDDPLQALGDAVAAYPATELVIVSSTESHWLEEGLLEAAHQLVPSVEVVAVTSVAA